MTRPKLTRESKDEFEDEWPMAARRAALATFDITGDDESPRAMRKLVEALGMPDVCERSRCRHARRCLTPKVDCAFLHAPWLEEYVFADMDAADAAQR